MVFCAYNLLISQKDTSIFTFSLKRGKFIMDRSFPAFPLQNYLRVHCTWADPVTLILCWAKIHSKIPPRCFPCLQNWILAFGGILFGGFARETSWGTPPCHRQQSHSVLDYKAKWGSSSSCRWASSKRPHCILCGSLWCGGLRRGNGHNTGDTVVGMLSDCGTFLPRGRSRAPGSEIEELKAKGDPNKTWCTKEMTYCKNWLRRRGQNGMSIYLMIHKIKITKRSEQYE